VGGEKRARFVNQQLIGFKGDLTVGETQLFANLVDGGPQRLVPLRIAQFEIGASKSMPKLSPICGPMLASSDVVRL
jgi:hypothetical protein